MADRVNDPCDVLTIHIRREDVAREMESRGVSCDAKKLNAAKAASMVAIDRLADKFKADVVGLIARNAGYPRGGRS